MKKQYVSLLAVLVSIGFFNTSCENKMNKQRGALEFDSIHVDVTTHLFGDTAKPSSNLKIAFVYPVKSSDDVLKDSLTKHLVSSTFGEKYTGTDVSAIVDQYKDTYVEEYRSDLEPMYLEDSKNVENKDLMRSWYSYYRGISTSVMNYVGDLLVYRIDFNEYTGGAHGVYSSAFLNFDLNTVTPLALDDIFVGDYSERISNLLWNRLMTDNKVSTKDELENMGYGLTGDLIPTENFFLDKDGITFYYNIYEFTPYVMGPVEIKLPYTALEFMLADNSIVNQLRK